MELFFFVSIGIILTLFIMRKSVSSFFFEKLDINISTKGISYFLIFALVAVFVIGTLFSDQKSKYGHISSGYEQMRPNPDPKTQDKKEEPHRWFNINFNIFNF